MTREGLPIQEQPLGEMLPPAEKVEAFIPMVEPAVSGLRRVVSLGKDLLQIVAQGDFGEFVKEVAAHSW